jgi:aminoglycoside/choline kinase family phosphotransferase
MKQIPEILSRLFHKWSGEEPEHIIPLRQSGSYRRYFRLTAGGKTAIGAYYNQVAENRAFISFTRHFLDFGMKVPEIYSVCENETCYLLEDLGDIVLFDHLKKLQQTEGFAETHIKMYKRVLNELIGFQMIAGKGIDFSLSYPAPAFDEQAYLWDLNYFKYNFLKPANISFDEFRLEKDFRKLTELLLTADHSWFVYRDFQARNIMLREDELFFIDYQGGRQGALHYDVASLLFQARAAIPFDVREELLDFYIGQVEKIAPAAVLNFRQHYYRFVLVRVLQTLGAYGFRGLFEKKRHFIESIPLALENVRWLLDHDIIGEELPELKNCLQEALNNKEIEQLVSPVLTLQINSFSYKRGIPVDLSGNGGGFVFDCRALPNPGREPEYAELTGRDSQVVAYLERYSEVEDFINGAFHMVAHAVKQYSARKFRHLMVSFGCTGGRHRSVYCAEILARRLAGVPNLEIVLRHREQE